MIKDILFNQLNFDIPKYIDANVFSEKQVRVELDKENVSVSKDTDSGLKFRLWDGDKFIEEATSDLQEVQKIFDNLSAQKVTGTHELKVDTQVHEQDYTPEAYTPISDIPALTQELKTLRAKILSYNEDIVNVRIVVRNSDEEHIFRNKYKKLEQHIPITVGVLVAYIRTSEGATKEVFKSFCSPGMSILEKMKSGLDEFFIRIEQMKTAKKLPGGKYKVVLSPKITGLLAHESFGHGMEADTLLKGRALASNYQGKQIGPSFVSIVDNPDLPGRHGALHFDNDGNVAKKTYLVKNGVIDTPIADLYSKSMLELEQSCNGRFESFDHKNYTRMTNTFFEEGETPEENLIASVSDGIYIISSSGGMEDPKSWGVQIQGCFGQRIKDGKLIDEFYDGFAITGFLPDIIGQIFGVGNNLEIEDIGFCGKGHKEWVRVSSGGPSLGIGEVVLG
ncbi:TldD/PmbA family protein [Candidatus Woesearchaeota archaeon]|nr:TldD/PmbA family protein [Candidatus Woesearchaeota archaeon]